MSAEVADIAVLPEPRHGGLRELRARAAALALLVRFVVAPPADDGRDDE